MICKICSANRTPPPSPFLSASFTGGCIESRWTLKHKPEVKVLTLMCVVLNSWALFPLSFWKSSPGARCSSIYQSRPHPSAAGRYNWHSSYQKSLQDSHSMEPTLRLCHHPPLLYPVRPRASADLHLAIWRWKKDELALPSSESRAEMEFFLSYFLFLISHPAVKYHIMQSRLRN